MWSSRCRCGDGGVQPYASCPRRQLSARPREDRDQRQGGKTVGPEILSAAENPTTACSASSAFRWGCTTSRATTPKTKWFNRWVRNAGTPPVIYDPMLMENSRLQMEKAMFNKGYMAARVEADTTSRGKRMDVVYRVQANEPHYIDDVNYQIGNDTLSRLIERRLSRHSALEEGRQFRPQRARRGAATHLRYFTAGRFLCLQQGVDYLHMPIRPTAPRRWT